MPHYQPSHHFFPFLNLPAELRVTIYELVLAPIPRYGPGYLAHDASIDTVVLGNALLLRTRTPPTHVQAEQADHAKTLYMQTREIWGLVARVLQATQVQPALRDTVVLQICKQIHDEAKNVLYSTTTFAVITPIVIMASKDAGKPFHLRLPSTIDVSKIRKFRLEVLLSDAAGPGYPPLGLIDDVFSSFRTMRNLRSLQVIVTHGTRALSFRASPRQPTLTTLQRAHLLRVAQAIPAHVRVTWGMSEEEKQRGDYGGFDPVEGEVLREIVNAQA